MWPGIQEITRIYAGISNGVITSVKGVNQKITYLVVKVFTNYNEISYVLNKMMNNN